jgi:hypothetical protein
MNERKQYLYKYRHTAHGRQVYAALQRRYRHGAKGRAMMQRQYQLKKQDPEKWRRLLVQRRAEKAQRKGRITRKACERCGKLEAQMHHPDYNKPFDVIWLCPLCHKQEHERIRDERNKIQNRT